MYRFQDLSFDPRSTFKFEKVPNNYWDDDCNVVETLRLLEKKLNIQNPDEWFRIPYNKLISMGMGTLLGSQGGLAALLTKYFPGEWVDNLHNYLETKWNVKTQLKGVLSKAQDELFKVCK